MKKVVKLLLVIVCASSLIGQEGFGMNLVRAAERDFYKILGVPRSAKEREIKKAFKKLSMKFHPDKNHGNEEAAKKYLDISSAYDALSDPEKRRKYDQGGEEGLSRQDNGGGGHDPFDFFFGGGGGRRQQEEQTGPNMNIKIKVTLEDIYSGKEMEIKYTRNTLCPHCRGTGADDPEDIHICPKCQGQGIVMETQRLGPGFVQQFQTQCNKCGGKGKTITSTCHQCRGANTKRALDELFLFIEAGTPDNHEEHYKDAGDEFVNIRAGEVVFKIQVLPHKRFIRDGDDLKLTQEITLKQALLGFDITIKHLDGHEVEIKKSLGSVTQPGEVMRIRDEGMPKYGMASEKGDLLVTFKVRNP